MNLHVRALAAAVALATVAVASFVYQTRMDRRGPPRPAPSLSAGRPVALPSVPPTARDILDQSVPLDLRGDQLVRLKALDRLWTREVSGLTAMIHEAEREFSVFAAEAQGIRKVSLPEIQRRSAEFSELSAELRVRRQHHSEAALRVLDDWQRQRVVPSRTPFAEGRSHEAAGN
jgi:hypothetical protein